MPAERPAPAGAPRWARQADDSPAEHAPSWHVIDGQVHVRFAGLAHVCELAIADLRGDALAEKLARALGLLPPPGAVPPEAKDADVDDDPLFPEDVPEAPSAAPAVSMQVGGVLWPPGPLGLSAERVAQLVREARTEREFLNPNDPGLSRSRLQKLLVGMPQNRLLAGALMVWCDAAGVLAPATTPRPFRTSRPLRDDLDDQAVAGRLAATPHPTADEVAGAYREG